MADEFRRFAQLRAEGLISDAEYEQQKARLLGGAVAAPDAITPVRSAPPVSSPRAGKPSLVAGLCSALVVLAAVVIVLLANQHHERFAIIQTPDGTSPRHVSVSTVPRDDVTAAESNIQTAFTGANVFYTQSNQTFTGILGGVAGVSTIRQLDTGLTYVSGNVASSGPSNVSLATGRSGEVVELVAAVPSKALCVSILDVKTPLTTPYFPGRASTAQTGTYYIGFRRSGRWLHGNHASREFPVGQRVLRRGSGPLRQCGDRLEDCPLGRMR